MLQPALEQKNETVQILEHLQEALRKFVLQYAAELKDPEILAACNDPGGNVKLEVATDGDRYTLTRTPVPAPVAANPASDEAPGCLSPRELEVETLVCQALRNEDIAKHLGIKTGTVAVHMRHIFTKRKVSSRGQLMLRRGLNRN